MALTTVTKLGGRRGRMRRRRVGPTLTAAARGHRTNTGGMPPCGRVRTPVVAVAREAGEATYEVAEGRRPSCPGAGRSTASAALCSRVWVKAGTEAAVHADSQAFRLEQ